MYLEIGVSITLILLVGFYFKTTRGYGSYESRGYPEDKGSFPIGSQMFWDLYFRRSSFRDYPNKFVDKFKNQPFFIAWHFGKPVVIVLDTELAKNILVKDFEVFPLRRPMGDLESESNKYFSNMMSIISDVEKWRKVRSMISPVFTSGKLKSMLPHLHETADKMLEFSTKIDLDMVDCRNYITRYTTQSIAKAGFGVEADCFNNEVEEPLFMEMVNRITSRKGSKWRQTITVINFLVLPTWMMKYVPISLLDPTSQRFFIDMVNQSIENRRKSNATRGDFVDLLLQELGKNKDGEPQEKDLTEEETSSQFDRDAQMKTSNLKRFSDEEMEVILISNVFILLFAGFETTSSMLTVMLVFLAKYPDVQEKIYQEVENAITQSGKEKLNYTDIMGLNYLECFIHESLRYFPFLTLERSSVRPYVIPGTDLEMDKGTLFIFPNSSYGLSEEHFKNPGSFDPNHFSEEEKRANSPYRFMAFGHGPRNCIGMRFALLQMKTILYRLIYNYKIVKNEKTVDEVVVLPTEFNPDIKGGAWVKFEKRSAVN